MTEQEAIEMMRGYQITDTVDRAEWDAFGMAISALEEIQQYRSLGTLEELTKMKEDYAEAINEWRQYRKIGTVEELQEAKEKQTPKKPNIWGDGHDEDGEIIYDMYDCPNCEKSYEIDYDKSDYCPNCGQVIDWRDDK